MNKFCNSNFARVMLSLVVLTVSVGVGFAQSQKFAPSNPITASGAQATTGVRCTTMRCVTNADRVAAANRAAALRIAATHNNPRAKSQALFTGSQAAAATAIPLLSGCNAPSANPRGVPDYMSGCVGNNANSWLPVVTGTVNPVSVSASGVWSGPTVTGSIAGGLRKFVDLLPSVPQAVPDKVTYPNSDYYEIELIETTVQMHADLPNMTRVRMYHQTNGGPAASYAGPIIVAQKGRPVRIKFTNKLPIGAGGNLFIPVDTTVMGSGMGADGHIYLENRSNIHLHGGNTPWISDGTPNQWTVPNGETTTHPKGISTVDVPDMPATNPGEMTLYYTNDQSARLMFYHDHAYGITRLNVYSGMAAGYLVQDPIENAMINGGTVPLPGGGTFTGIAGSIPADQIPLIIQDKTFVPPADQLAAQDPTWGWGSVAEVASGNFLNGSLWFPHVYMPNQNPSDSSGANAMGRWDWGPWFWPPMDTSTLVAGAQEWACPTLINPGQTCPGLPNPSLTPESFMDTPVVNGKAYPVLQVKPQAYRLRILNASNDRSWNLSLYQGVDSTGTVCAGLPVIPVTGVNACSEVRHISPPDGIAGQGPIPDPLTKGPNMIQIGTEAGLIPNAVTLTNQPIVYNYNRRDIVVLNVAQKNLWLGPAERADVIVDFSQYAGQTLILYNDSPAPVPAFDTRFDYYTGDPDQTLTGGAPTTLPGYGPNTRTVMQIQVAAGGGSAFNRTALDATLPAAFAASQPAPVIAEAAYATAFPATISPTVNSYGRIQDTSLFTGSVTGISVNTPGSGYTVAPTVTIGAPAAFAGATQATAVATIGNITVGNVTTIGAVTGITITNPGVGYFSTPLITITGNAADTAGKGASANAVGLPMLRKTIQELFELNYGRMNATLGTELPLTSFNVQTTVPLGYIDTPTESFVDGTPQIWKITHNGVDTHAIHFHLFNVQVINRVGWDGAVRAPDANEIGWKETVKMSPLEDVIVAFLPIHQNLPFSLPDSIRPQDVTADPGASILLGDLQGGAASMQPNAVINYGQEYVWHCHLLGHEENDMMRPMIFQVAPEAPSGLSASLTNSDVQITFTNNSAAVVQNLPSGATANLTGYLMQRDLTPAFNGATLKNFPTTTAPTLGSAVPGTVQFTDTAAPAGSLVFYRVQAFTPNGFSGWSNTAQVGLVPSVTLVPPSPLMFPDQLVGSSSAPQTITVSNVGTGILMVAGVAITGANPGDFSQTNNCSVVPATTGTCTISVTFAPTFVGARAGNLVFTTNDPINPKPVVVLNGNGLGPVLTMAPAALLFGNQPLNTTSAPPLTVTVSNPGTAPLIINSIGIVGVNAADFALTQTCGTIPATLPIGATCTVNLSFSPAATGARSAMLVVVGLAPATSALVPLSGTGTTANPLLLPSSLTFVNQLVNSTSTAQTVTLSNTGLAPLSIAGISLTGTNATDFAQQTTTCGTTLGANLTCTVSVTFKPLARGPRTAKLVVSDGFPLTTQSVLLSGTGIAPVIIIQPVPLVFGVQVIATTSAIQPLIVSNIGDAPLLFTGVTIGGLNATDYVWTNNCGAVLPVLGSCTLDVAFTPSLSGASSAVLIIANSDPFNLMLSVPVSGLGTALAVSPTALAFPSQTVGTSTTSRTVTLINSGGTALVINSITLAGVNATDFTLNNQCGGSLNSGRSCTVSLRFRPTATGALSASLVINTSDIGVPQATVALSGTGLAAALAASPTTLTFSSPLNTPGVAQVVTVSNIGTAPLTINGVNLGGTNTGQFIQNNNCPIGTTLAVAATCTINVSFSPTSTTPLVKSQTLNINVAAPATSQSIPLTGTVITPTYAVSPAAAAFGTQAINTTSQPQLVVVTNSGTVPLTLTNIAIGGSNRFAQTSNCGTTNFRPFPATLAPTASCTINVTFRPTTATTSNGSLSVSVGGGATPAQTQLVLTGTGQ